MCGVAGCVGRSVGDGESRAVVERMSAALAHRGPDDAGLSPLRSIAGVSMGVVGHRRLAILDLSAAGHQPMADATGRFTIVFNGEIYNFRALRRELEGDVAFRSDGDTEVLLAGLSRQGVGFLRRLRGMFALAMWDASAQRLTLARDRFGMKPLYYAEIAGGFLFASELRALLASERVPRRLRGSALATYLATGAVGEPETAIEGVRLLPAGHLLEVCCLGDEVRIGSPRRFAAALEPSGDAVDADPLQARARVKAALRDSVAHHLVSDVPVALFLSGGVDSAIIAALAAEHGGQGIDAFTVSFAERRFDELPAAAEVARRFGIRQHVISLSGEGLAGALPDAFAAMDQPSLDGINTFVISRAVRDAGYKVVLSGLGGDELFAGYPSFLRARLLARLGRPAGQLLRSSAALFGRGMRGQKLALLFGELDPARDAYIASRTLFPPAIRRALLDADPRLPDAAPAGLSLLQESSWFELTNYMRNTLLRDSDGFSMASALELRVPFIDLEVAAASLRIEDALKSRRGRGKAILVDAFRDVLPESVWNRPKQGFVLPFENWMRGSLAPEIAAALGDRARLERIGLRSGAVWDLWSRFSAGTRDVSWSRPWALYTLLVWAERVGASVGSDSSYSLATEGAA